MHKLYVLFVWAMLTYACAASISPDDMQGSLEGGDFAQDIEDAFLDDSKTLDEVFTPEVSEKLANAVKGYWEVGDVPEGEFGMSVEDMRKQLGLPLEELESDFGEWEGMEDGGVTKEEMEHRYSVRKRVLKNNPYFKEDKWLNIAGLDASVMKEVMPQYEDNTAMALLQTTTEEYDVEREKRWHDMNNVPMEYDFKKEYPECVVPPMNQGKCGSCVAHAVATSITSRMCRAAKDLGFEGYNVEKDGFMVSRQDLTGCCGWTCSGAKADGTSDGCNGNWGVGMDHYLTHHGVSRKECMPYRATKTNEMDAGQYCSPKCENTGSFLKRKDRVFSGFIVPPNTFRGEESFIMKQIMNFGPIIAGIQTFPDLFKYKKGVYFSPMALKSRPLGGHAMTVYGWGVDSSGKTPIKYWLIQNSWGGKWGTGGDMKFLRGNNHCRIRMNMHAPVPDFKKLAYVAPKAVSVTKHGNLVDPTPNKVVLDDNNGVEVAFTIDLSSLPDDFLQRFSWGRLEFFLDSLKEKKPKKGFADLNLEEVELSVDMTHDELKHAHGDELDGLYLSTPGAAASMFGNAKTKPDGKRCSLISRHVGGFVSVNTRMSWVYTAIRKRTDKTFTLRVKALPGVKVGMVLKGDKKKPVFVVEQANSPIDIKKRREQSEINDNNS